MAGDQPEAETVRYEYRIKDFGQEKAAEEVMNEMGAQGWRYVELFELSSHSDSLLSSGTTHVSEFLVFEREIND